MNLFCFTLEGSTESIYEPADSQTLKDVLPRYQCSPALRRRKAEWGGSDPSINSDRPQRTVKVKRNNRRSCVPTSPLDGDTLDKDINHACWMSSGDKKDLSHQMKVPNREMCKAARQSSMLTSEDRAKELNSDRKQTDRPAQGSDTAESVRTTGKLKTLHYLVQTKTGRQHGAGKETSTPENNDHLADVFRNNSPVLTCICLGRRAEKKPSDTQQQHFKDAYEDPEEKGVWSPAAGKDLWKPFESPKPWAPFYHTCRQPRQELWVCGGTLSPARMAEWDGFESLIQELDSKQSDQFPPRTTCSITDTQEQNVDPAKVRLQRREACTSSHGDRKHVKASAEKTLTAIINGSTQEGEAEAREAGGGGRRQARNSVESLYSLNSGQSSSSGVTSGSGCSSNRGSLRLEDDLLYPRQFCGRARVHTAFVPSPYDTESLRLKVEDVIDVIAKPPMGIWTGVLKGRVGNFKFIYVDVLTEESPETQKKTQTRRVRQKSTIQDVLKHLTLEESSSSLQVNSYQTVELNVTDPEHGRRLLAAVDSLQKLPSDSQLENEASREAKTPTESMKADMNNCPRDSGCHMPCDSPDNSAEDADLHCICEYPLPAQTAES